MSARFDIRPARKSDAGEVALLVNIAVHGNMAHGWRADERAQGTYEPLEVGRLEMLEDDPEWGWRAAWIAEADGEVAGMLLGYRKGETREAVPDDTWAPLRPIIELESQANGLWFLSMLGVHQPWRGHGAGSVLLDKAEALAQETGARGQALIVGDENTQARRLYERRGFQVRDKRAMVPFPGVPPEGGDWLLMIKDFFGHG